MAAPLAEALEHEGPWTEEAYLALPEDRRIELLDGALLVSPHARGGHQRMSTRVEAALGRAALDGLEVLPTVNVRVAPGRLLIPDLVVITETGLDELVYEASVLAMVVEISGQHNLATAARSSPPSTPRQVSRTTCASSCATATRSGSPTGCAADATSRRSGPRRVSPWRSPTRSR